MLNTLTAIAGSPDLAAVLNVPPAFPEEAAETPRDWLAGIWVAGTVYPLDPQATTETLAVLADGTAAAEFSPRGSRCHGRHRSGNESYAAHWCVTGGQEWTFGRDVRGVVRDWRSVNVWDANGFSDTTLYDTVEEAEAAFDQEVAEMKTYSTEDDDQGDEQD